MSEPQFDRHQFDNKRTHPVSKETEISYEDYSRMSTHQHKPSGERRLPTPIWAVNDRLLQELLIVFAENRAMMKPTTGTTEERLAAARTALLNQRSNIEETLKRMCEEFMFMKKNGLRLSTLSNNGESGEPINFDPIAALYFKNTHQANLQLQIESCDTNLRISENGGGIEMIAAVVYLYYRAMLDSVGVGEQLNIKPPHVRQILYRLHRVWNSKLADRYVAGAL